MKLLINAIITRFNKPNTHLVISHWPRVKGSFDGIATYTKDTVTNLARYSGDKFVVLAETEANQPRFELVRKNVLLVRAFDSKQIHLFPQILTWLKTFSQVSRVYIHSEFCASGGPHLRLLMIPFLLLIKMTGRTITFYAHNVVLDFSRFAPHFGKPMKHWSLPLWSFGYQMYFRLISLIVDQHVVLEGVIRDRLKYLAGKRSIVVAPHWVKRITPMNQIKAKKQLGLNQNDPLIVSFGFVTWYKGADIVAAAAAEAEARHQKLNFKFVLAGGPADSLKAKQYYRKYYRSLQQQAKRLPNLNITGFLSEKEKYLWLSAADLIILPYRDLMGGSGALQQALQFGKPILMSENMAQYLDWDKRVREEIVFSLTPEFLLNALKTKNNKRLMTVSRQLAANLSIDILLPEHYLQVYALQSETMGGVKYDVALAQSASI